MAVLDRVMELQAQGMSDQEISKKMRDEGTSPQEINDAISQSKIKQAVSQSEDFQGMEQSIMEQTAAPQQQAQEYYPPQQYYSEQQYQQPSIDNETVSEIADQVVQEKFAEYNKKTGDIVAFKNEVKDKIRDLDDRLKRIESNIDLLQRSVIGKIGEYGENITLVQKDLTNIHDTMSKMMNPLIDNYQQLRKIAGK
jgi:hypothetical protein